MIDWKKESNNRRQVFQMHRIYSTLMLLLATTCSGDLQHAPADAAIIFARKSEMIGKMNLLNGEEIETHYIAKENPKMFVYLLQWDVPWLTITVTPCAVPVAWSVRNITASGERVDLNLNGWIPRSYDFESRTFEQENATKGAYQVGVSVAASAGGGYVQIFVSTAGPTSLLRPTANLTLTNRRHKGQISVRWPPSTVDPHVISYWLVVNPLHPTRALCQAKVMAGIDLSQPFSVDDFSITKGQLTIDNLGSRTSSIIRGLRLGQNYSVEVFVVNNLTGLTYKYGSERAVRYARTRPLPLRDGRISEANLRRLDGRATFRYKVPATFTGTKLEWSVIVCGVGTVVDAEVRHRRRTVVPRREIVGYSTLSFSNPTPGTTYILRLNSTEPEMLARITQVQVLGTTRGLQEPVLPKGKSLHEYKSARGCRSVVLGWIPSSVSSITPESFNMTEKITVHNSSHLMYCITTREVSKSDSFTPAPDQCAHSVALKNNDYTTSFCFHRPVNRKMITKEVGHLKPGRFYDIQVAVRQGSSRIFSYEKIRVRTKPQSLC